MSDQNVITDWKAYFLALGPGTPFSKESLAAMEAVHLEKNGPTKTMLIIDHPANYQNGAGGLMETVEVEIGISIEDARSYWDVLNPGVPRPNIWLQREWPWGVTIHIPPEPVQKGNRKKKGTP